ncbi:MAG: ABC transporter permease subunit, partial [Candidatus Omnitrophota bacterium]
MSNQLPTATGLTLLEAGVGFLTAVVGTSLVAALFALWSWPERVIAPAAVILQSIPILCVAPLLSLWFGPKLGSKIAASFIVCFFPLLSGWSSGIKSVNPDEKDLFITFGASKYQLARYLIFPRSLPFFFSGLKVAAPLSIL